ncbi:MAG TPA: indole-3-glycerol phosphate synthase TrpC [Candidatus Hydrogenedentes bacterium]|nr:indole-3-glycerol phosphate synthase TrpC [Candidatus Hydrogenedentota bacterium]HIJ72509.1 indole-3-glycerol phosphate synthase TrpC [Candidatus Hydrogenedentota bacterium]
MILDEICRHKREEVAARKRSVPLDELLEQIQRAYPVRDFRNALRIEGISLIAEVKRASPSRGVLIEELDVMALAGLYEQTGARAISVLTDARFFHGSLDDLIAIRRDVTVPCLRKDFTIDEYQIYEARAAHADAVLLIVRVLSDQQIKDYLALTSELHMAALVETHDKNEIERALNAGAHIIGINNRDLSTFTVNIDTTLELRKIVPGGNVLVSESGIQTRDHVRMLEDGGVDAILVGEALVTSDNISEKIHELLGAAAE